MKGVDLNINSENPSNKNSDEEDEEKKSSTKLNEEGEDEVNTFFSIINIFFYK